MTDQKKSKLRRFGGWWKKTGLTAADVAMEHVVPVALDAFLPPGLDNLVEGLIDSAWDKVYDEATNADGSVDQSLLRMLLTAQIKKELADAELALAKKKAQDG